MTAIAPLPPQPSSALQCTLPYAAFSNATLVFSKKPLRKLSEIPEPFVVLQPYPLAISELGKIKISGMPDEPWSPVEFAKKLGLRFATVDLTVKRGSSWWLYRPVVEDEIFRLLCPYPEENFPVYTAVLASLFCNGVDGGFMNPIVDTAVIGTLDFGTMLRNPPFDISLDTYYAVVETSDVNLKAGFLDGITNIVPALGGVNIKDLLDDATEEVGGKQLLDFKDRMGDRIQVFLE